MKEVPVALSVALHGTIAPTATDSDAQMSGNKRVRAKPSVVSRFTVERSALVQSAHARSPCTNQMSESVDRLTTRDVKASSAQSIATSIMGLMMLAANTGAANRVTTNSEETASAKAALAQLIATRFGDDE
jgi:phosphotransferase system HPr-like phosphotransfer protein